ncbi:MAG: response regulator [SAR324 cluster bacterium]|nr:response regulator [SAR324 cluster bacterium]
MNSPIGKKHRIITDTGSNHRELICRYRRDGTLTFVNGPCCDYFCIFSDGWHDVNIFDLLSEEESESWQLSLQNMTPENSVSFHEQQLIDQNGGIFLLEWVHIAQFNKHSQVIEFLSVGRNKTTTKLQETSNFIIRMNHEIRKPLNAIMGFSQLLRNQAIVTQLPGSMIQKLDNICMSAQVLSEVINDTMEFARIDSGQLKLVEEPINIRQFFTDIHTLHKFHAQSKQLDYTCEVSADLPEHLLSDRHHLTLILNNLLENAIKFTPSQHSVKLVATRKNSDLQIDVIDTGIGMTQKQQKNMFEPFDRRYDSNTNQEGTGLGLTLVKKCCSSLNGRLEWNSIPDVGTTFSITLPLREYSFTNRPDTTNGHNPPRFSPENIIVIFEDDLMTRQMMTAVFEWLSLDLLHATTETQTIETVQSIVNNGKIPDLILLDLKLWNSNELELISKLRQINGCQNVPVVFITDHSNKGVNVLQDSNVSSLLKPINLPCFLEILGKYLKPNSKPVTSDSIQKPALTIDIVEYLQKELNTLSEIPMYHLEKILLKIQHLYEEFQQHFPTGLTVLNQLRQVAAIGSSEQFTDCVARIHSMLIINPD